MSKIKEYIVKKRTDEMIISGDLVRPGIFGLIHGVSRAYIQQWHTNTLGYQDFARDGLLDCSKVASPTIHPCVLSVLRFRVRSGFVE